jgi:hypothetical protein
LPVATAVALAKQLSLWLGFQPQLFSAAS